MSRLIGNPSSGSPWYAKWTNANLDLGSTNPDDAPVDVTQFIVGVPPPAPTMLTCTFGAGGINADSANPEWHLTIENTSFGAAPLATNRTVIAVMSAVSSTTLTVRMHRRDNSNPGTPDNDVRVHVPIQFDLRSLQELSAYKYYIALANKGVATNCYLLDIVATPEAL